MRSFTTALFMAALAIGPAGALASPAALDLKDPVYATRVDSTIEIGPDGRLVGYEPITQLKEPLASRVRTMATSLRFEPVLVDGKPVIARTRMRLHLVAEPMDDGNLRVSVEDVGFPSEGETYVPSDDAMIRGVKHRKALQYPSSAMRAYASGRVLVAMRMTPDGRVAEAIPRESALFHANGSRATQAAALAAMERAAVEGVRAWRFDVRVPEGAQPAPGDLTGLIAVQYTMGEGPMPGPGQWVKEMRTSERVLPWLDSILSAALPDIADVGDAGHFGAAAQRFKLLTPVEGVVL